MIKQKVDPEYSTIQNSKYDLTLDHDVWDFTIFPGQECRIEKKYGVLPLVVKPRIFFQSYTPNNFLANIASLVSF